MTCSRDRFLSDIARKHIFTGFPLIVSLAKPPSAFSRSVRLVNSGIPSSRRSSWLEGRAPGLPTGLLGRACKRQSCCLPKRWEEESFTLSISPHPLEQMGPDGCHQLSNVGAPQGSLGAGVLQGFSWLNHCHSVKVQQNTVQILEIQVGPKADRCWGGEWPESSLWCIRQILAVPWCWLL